MSIDQNVTISEQNSERAPWETPDVRAIRAGEAEAFGGGADDGGPGGVNFS